MGRRDRRERQGPLHSIVGALTSKAGGQNQPRAQSEDGYDRGYGGQQNQSGPQYDDRNDYRDGRGSRRERQGPLHSIVGALTSKTGGQDQPRSQSGTGYDRGYENQQNQTRPQYDDSNSYQNDRGFGRGGRQGPIHSIIGAITSKVGEQSQSKPKYSSPNPDNVAYDPRSQGEQSQSRPQYENDGYDPRFQGEQSQSRPQYENDGYNPRFQGEQSQYRPQYESSNGNGYERDFGAQQSPFGNGQGPFEAQSEPRRAFADDRGFSGSPQGNGQSSGFVEPYGMPPTYEASRNQPQTGNRQDRGMYEME